MSVAFRENSRPLSKFSKHENQRFFNFKSIQTRQYNELMYYCHIKFDHNYLIYNWYTILNIITCVEIHDVVE